MFSVRIGRGVHVKFKTKHCVALWIVLDWADSALLITEKNSRVVRGLLLLADECPYNRNLLSRPSLHLLCFYSDPIITLVSDGTPAQMN